MKKDAGTQTTLTLFEEQTIRRVWYQDTWYFSIIDVIAALTDSKSPRRYWSDLKRKLEAEGYHELYENIVQLKLASTTDNKHYVTDTANTTTLLRIVQTIPSPKAEPLKRWLADVGAQRIEEIENPEAAIERMRQTLEDRGYPKDWIELRMRSIAIRNELTTEWKERGAQDGLEYAILTSEIATGTFGITNQQHQSIKGLSKRHIVKDHMTNLELVLGSLGDATAIELHQGRDSQGFTELQRDAKEAGEVAGSARKDIEARTGTPVVSSSNFLHLTNGKKQKKQIKGPQQKILLPLDEE